MAFLQGAGLIAVVFSSALFAEAEATRGDADKPQNAPVEDLPAGAVARFGTTRLRHAADAEGVAFSPDGKLLASVGRDNVTRIWEVATGRAIRELPGGVFGVCFSPDGNKLATSGDGECGVFLWDLNSGRKLFSAQANQGRRVFGVAFSPDGTRFATSADDGVIDVWDAGDGSPVSKLENGGRGGDAHALAYSADGRWLASGHMDRIRIWSLQTRKDPIVIKLPANGIATDKVVSLAFVGNEPKLISSGTRVTEGRRETGEPTRRWISEIRRWDPMTGEEFSPLGADTPEDGSASMAISRDGHTLATAHYDKFELWDPATGKPRRVISVEKQNKASWRTHGLALSTDGNFLAAPGRGNDIRLWNAETGEPLLDFPGHRELVVSVSSGPGKKPVATAAPDRSVRLWDPESGRQLSELTMGECWIRTCAISPDGTMLAACGDLHRGPEFVGAVSLWPMDNLRRQKRIELPDRAGAMAFSPDGRILAVATSFFDGLPDEKVSENLIHLLDVGSGKILARLSGQSGCALSMAFSPDSKTLLTFGDKRTIQRWDVASGEKTSNRDLDAKVRRGWVHLGRVVFTRDANGIVLSPLESDVVYVIDVESGTIIKEIAVPETQGSYVAISRNGRLLASAFRGVLHKDGVQSLGDNSLHVWSLETGAELMQFPSVDGGVASLEFSADGTRLFAGSPRGTTLVWDTAPAIRKLP